MLRPSPQHGLARPRILTGSADVEDEPGLRSYLVPLLEREEFTVDAVASGGEALAAIHDRRPDLVLLDVGLPDI